MSILWTDVLRHFEKNGYVTNGLTLPFLVGFQRVLFPGKPLLSIGRIIHEASTIATLHGITTFRCNYIGEYVLGSLDSETNEYRKKNKGVYQEFGNFLVVDDTFKNCADINQVINEFEKKYSQYITAGQFSKVAGQWQYYTETDQERIRELIPATKLYTSDK